MLFLLNNTIIANIIVDLEHELKLLKLIVKKHKYKLGQKISDVWAM